MGWGGKKRIRGGKRVGRKDCREEMEKSRGERIRKEGAESDEGRQNHTAGKTDNKTTLFPRH